MSMCEGRIGRRVRSAVDLEDIYTDRQTHRHTQSTHTHTQKEGGRRGETAAAAERCIQTAPALICTRGQRKVLRNTQMQRGRGRERERESVCVCSPQTTQSHSSSPPQLSPQGQTDVQTPPTLICTRDARTALRNTQMEERERGHSLLSADKRRSFATSATSAASSCTNNHAPHLYTDAHVGIAQYAKS